MRKEIIFVVAWQAQSRGSVVDEIAYPLRYSLRYFFLHYVVQQPCWHNPVKGPSHVK